MKPNFHELAKETLEELGLLPDPARTEYLAEVLRKQYTIGADDVLEMIKR